MYKIFVEFENKHTRKKTIVQCIFSFLTIKNNQTSFKNHQYRYITNQHPNAFIKKCSTPNLHEQIHSSS